MLLKTKISFFLAVIGILLLIQIDYNVFEITKFHLEQKREIQEARELQHNWIIKSQIPYKGHDGTKGFGLESIESLQRDLEKVDKQYHSEKAKRQSSNH